MTTPTTSALARRTAYRDFLATLQLNPALRDNHTVEFDLRGALNPTAMLSRLFEQQQGMLSFEEFADHYWRRHHAAVRQEHARLAKILRDHGLAKLKSTLGDYAGRYAKDFQPVMTDDELKQGIVARLYRTQAGIYTEYDAYLSCAAALGVAAVQRSAALDSRGVDFTLTVHGRTANIHIFRDGINGRRAKFNKIRNKQGFQQPGIHVFFPYDIHGRSSGTTQNLGNGFYVYQDSYVTDLIAFLQQLPPGTEVVDRENGVFCIKRKSDYTRLTTR